MLIIVITDQYKNVLVFLPLGANIKEIVYCKYKQIINININRSTWDGGSIEQKNTGSGTCNSTPRISIDSSCVIFFDLDNLVRAFLTALLLLESRSPHTVL